MSARVAVIAPSKAVPACMLFVMQMLLVLVQVLLFGVCPETKKQIRRRDAERPRKPRALVAASEGA